MNIVLSKDTQKLLEECMNKGGYENAEDAVRAGLMYLKQQVTGGDFAPGELAALLAQADADIEKGNLIDREEVFRDICRMREDPTL